MIRRCEIFLVNVVEKVAILVLWFFSFEKKKNFFKYNFTNLFDFYFTLSYYDC